MKARTGTGNRTASFKAVAVLGACVLSGSLACVSSGKYDAMVAERDKVNQDRAGLVQEVDQLENQLSELEGSRNELEGKLSEREREVGQLKSTYDGLVTDLKTELESGQIQIEQMRNGIRLNVDDDILFPSGSAKLDTGGEDVLKKVAGQVLKSSHRVEVEGHTDNVPISSTLKKRYPSNWDLAGARATSVVRLLESEGIQGTRLRATSLGQHHPVAQNVSEDGRSRNRRIEIRLVPAVESEVAKAPETESKDEGSVPASARD